LLDSLLQERENERKKVVQLVITSRKAHCEIE